MIRYCWTIINYSPSRRQHYADFILEFQRRDSEDAEWETFHSDFYGHDWDDPTTPLGPYFTEDKARYELERLGIDYSECVESVVREVFDRGGDQ